MVGRMSTCRAETDDASPRGWPVDEPDRGRDTSATISGIRSVDS
jgi:hypothetical protein